VDPTATDLTNNAGTTFTFTPNIGNVGSHSGNTYTSENGLGNYSVNVSATFNDGLGGTCTDSTTLFVTGTQGGGNSDNAIAYGAGAGAAALILFLLAHHSTTDKIEFDPGEEAKKKSEARVLDPGLESYGQALPDDSLFNTGKPGDKTGK